jgi:hypothetical protein
MPNPEDTCQLFSQYVHVFLGPNSHEDHMVNMTRELQEELEDSREHPYASSLEIQSHNRGVFQIDSSLHQEARSTLHSSVAWPARREEIQKAKEVCMAKLEELQRQYVRRNKAKYPHTSKEPSSSNQQANQATNALLPTPQGPKRNVASFFDQNRSGQPTRNVSSSGIATNQQAVQVKSATNQQAFQGKSAPNQQTIQGNGVAPNVDFTCFSIEAELPKVKIPIPSKS